MTYIVLARKWRPRTFADVVGQEHVTQTLVNALQNNRIAHAYIFAGPRGVGKTTVARLLARAANAEADEKDLFTKDFEASIHHLDLIEIDGASNRGIDEIRNLRENIRFAPASSKYKIYIIDEVHMLSKDAFNALLKTLEEPPGHAIFIFATTEIHKVPLTILSRCQRFDFKRIPTAQIADQLQKISTAEKIEVDRESLTLIARKSDGGMRDATSLLDQIRSFTTGAITVPLIQDALGIITEDIYFDYTRLMRAGDEAGIIEYAQKIFAGGHDLLNYLNGLQLHFRNLLVTRSTGNAKLLETADSIRALYEKEAAEYDTRDILLYLDLLIQNENLLKFSENPRLIIELLLLKLAHKPKTVDLEKLLKMMQDAPGDYSGGGQKKSQAKPAAPTPQAAPVKSADSKPVTPAVGNKIPPLPGKSAPEASPPGDKFARLKSFNPPGGSGQPTTATVKMALADAPTINTPTREMPESPAAMAAAKAPPQQKTAPVVDIELAVITQQWVDIITEVRREKIALASFLQDGLPYRIIQDTLLIAFEPKTGFHAEHVRKNAAIIETIINKRFNTRLKIDCTSVDFSSEGLKKQVLTPEEKFEKMKDKEPVLKKIIDLFDCENLDE